MTAQRLLAVTLTAMLFAIVILGFGLIFAIFGHRYAGMAVGAVFCALMVAGFVREGRRSS